MSQEPRQWIIVDNCEDPCMAFSMMEDAPVCSFERIQVIEYSALQAEKDEANKLWQQATKQSAEILDLKDQLRAECEKVATLESKIHELIKVGQTMNRRIHDDFAKLEAIEALGEEMAAALKYYSPLGKWAEFISGGNVFDEQDGDPIMAFNSEGPDPELPAIKALKKWEGRK